MNSANVLLEAQAIGRVAFDTRKSLLRDVSLRVFAGDRLAIAGPSGAGKTLLLRALALLDPIDEGRVLWHGQPIEPGQVPDFRRQVVYVQQRPAMIEGSVEENLRLPFSFRVHAADRYHHDRVLAMFQSIGRGGDLLGRKGRDLSGGEAQIVALVRVLQLDPTMLLLDEPTAALDAAAVEAIERLVTAWHEQAGAGRALIWVTHDAKQAVRVAKRTLTMDAGQLLVEA